MRLTRLVLILDLILITACSTTPLGRQQLAVMPAAQMDQMGIQAFDTMKTDLPVYTDAHTNEYVNCVASAITGQLEGDMADTTWEVVVFKDDTANAFALPGGKIGVHTGLLSVATNQHQLAAVLGHEVAHVLASHSNERVSQEFAVSQGLSLVNAVASPQTALGQTAMQLLGVGAQYGVLMPYSRLHESEADMLGLDLMAKAGFDPRESVTLWENMSSAGGAAPPEFLSTHPSHTTRITDLQERIPSAMELRRKAISRGNNPRCEY